MKNSYLKFFILLVAMGLLVFLGFTKIKVESPLVRFIEKPSVFLFSKISYLSSFVTELKKIRNLAGENTSLREDNLSLLSRIATQLHLEEENKFLREAVNLTMPSGFKVIDAGTFNINFGPDGHRLLINKGLIDGIETDSSVISSSGVLIGRVLEVFDSYSVVGAITDPNFKTTVRIMEINVFGIARGNLQDGLYIDFISQDDEVKNGDMAVTDGSDLFPAGLIVGRIIYVSVEDGSVFKEVRVEPMMNSINISKVIVLVK